MYFVVVVNKVLNWCLLISVGLLMMRLSVDVLVLLVLWRNLKKMCSCVCLFLVFLIVVFVLVMVNVCVVGMRWLVVLRLVCVFWCRVIVLIVCVG